MPKSRITPRKPRPVVALSMVLLLNGMIAASTLLEAANDPVPKWKQFRLSLPNSTWNGNPFDVRLAATFTGPQGRTLTQLGFYAGDDTWKIYFMPDQTGRWTYKTFSPDPELEGHTGEFQCVQSPLPGQLVPAGPDNTRWKFVDGDFLMPMLWGAAAYEEGRGHYRAHGADNPKVKAALDKAKAVGATLVHSTALVLAERDWTSGWPEDAMAYVKGREGKRFHLPFWDRLNDRFDAIRDRGMGLYVMLYTDDALKPDNLNIAPGSKAEKRLYRYVVARLAPYPILLWDSGIDIREYRDQQWVNRFVDWFNQHDPWQHPTSSRHGGGSGSLIADNQTYDSVGGAGMPSRADLLGHLNKPLPTAHTDHWRVFISRGDWTNRKLRTVLWRCGLSRGQAPFPDYSQGNFDRDVMEQGAEWIGHATRFFRQDLQHGFGRLEPDDAKVISGSHAIAAVNPGLEMVVYDENGGELEIDLSEMQGTLTARWYNPREGSFSRKQTVEGGQNEPFRSPTTGEDWLFHLYRNQ